MMDQSNLTQSKGLLNPSTLSDSCPPRRTTITRRYCKQVSPVMFTADNDASVQYVTSKLELTTQLSEVTHPQPLPLPMHVVGAGLPRCPC